MPVVDFVIIIKIFIYNIIWVEHGIFTTNVNGKIYN